MIRSKRRIRMSRQPRTSGLEAAAGGRLKFFRDLSEPDQIELAKKIAAELRVTRAKYEALTAQEHPLVVELNYLKLKHGELREDYKLLTGREYKPEYHTPVGKGRHY